MNDNSRCDLYCNRVCFCFLCNLKVVDRKMNIYYKSPDKRKPPVDDYIETLPRCKNCGEAFEEHIDIEDGYLCSWEHQRQPTYGGFYGGDPRLFHPDYEVCSEQEILNYKMACLRADSNPRERDLPCDSCSNRKFGIGVTTYPPSLYERSLPSMGSPQE